MKLLFFDLETTGTDPQVNGVYEISGAIVIDRKVVEKFEFKVRPHKLTTIDPEAFKVRKDIDVKAIKKYPKPKKVHKLLEEILGKYVDKFDKKDKYFLAGYNNAKFDNEFLRSWFLDCEDKYYGSWFWSNPIDVMVLATWKLMDKRHNMVDFKLHTVAKEFGIKVNEKKLHSSLYDALLTYDIFDRLHY